MTTLVLGIGNILLRDEGAGVRAVEEFARRFVPPDGVDVVDGGTCGMELLHHLEGRDTVILVDVVKNGKACGSVTRFEGDEVPAFFGKKISPHQLGISDLLAALHLRGTMPAKIVLLGVEPGSIETGLELTAEVAESIDALVVMIAEELRKVGVPGGVNLPKQSTLTEFR